MAKKQIGTEGDQSAKKSGVLTNPIRNLIITAIVGLALGLAFLLQPNFVQDYCGLILGGLIGGIGLLYIIIYFCRKPVGGVYRSEFAIGCIALAAGVYVLLSSLKPDTTGLSVTLRFIVTVLGLLIAADGVLKLQYSFDLARMKFGGWWFAMILSLLGIALGVLMTMGLVDEAGVRFGYWAEDFMNAMLFLGIAFCVNAWLDIITVIMVAVRNGKAARADTAAALAAAQAAAAAAPTYYSPAPAPAPAPAAAPAAQPVVTPVEPAAPASEE